MRMRRAFLPLLAPALLLLGAACSSDEDPTPAPTAATTATGEATTTATAMTEPLKIGLLLVGPRDDHGWSQAHFEGAQYAAEALGAELIVVDKVNPADSPNVTIPQIVDDMVAQGVGLILATSDDMKDGILEAAAAHPDVPMIWASGDNAWTDGLDFRPDLANLGNIMGEMEYGKMIAGCAAALQSESGQISYLGPLINDETRRLVNSSYLGARHCWTEVRGNDAADLQFNVTWIGFWFNIPGVTLDPTQVVNEFHANGTDVIISGIDTTEGIVRTGQVAAEGQTVWAVPYDFEDACSQAPEVCLGVPYFNWGPAYLETAQSVIDGSFTATFQWLSPDWADINNPDTSAIGFLKGDGLTEENATALDEFIAGLASGSLNLWSGPLNFQDGSAFLAEGATATPQQVWYMKQLLEGIEGASAAE
ncbi:MAG: BMP family ABC transporter substrate-binding protein [Dehalococcoidia bacterium]|nr:BMP family ABC transporter substrate-binding protein [Dehalococcoidia bacterium]